MKKPKRGGVHPIQEVLDAILASSGLEPDPGAARVFRAWREAAGPDLSRRARPARFRSGVLLIEVSSAAHLHELESFTGEDVRRRTNERIGRELVRSLQFKLRR